MERPNPPLHPTPDHFLTCFLLLLKGGGVSAGYFHCKEGRQEVEMKPGLSAVSLNTGPQQGQLTVNSHDMGEGGGGGIVKWGTNGLNHASLFDPTWLLLVTGTLNVINNQL